MTRPIVGSRKMRTVRSPLSPSEEGRASASGASISRSSANRVAGSITNETIRFGLPIRHGSRPRWYDRDAQAAAELNLHFAERSRRADGRAPDRVPLKGNAGAIAAGESATTDANQYTPGVCQLR